MKTMKVVLAALLVSGLAAMAQAPAGAPAGANGICKDGTYSTAATKAGACRGHNGVQTWYTAPPAKPGPAPVIPTPAASAAQGKAAPAAMAAPTPAASMPSQAAPKPATNAPAAAPATAAAPGKKLSPEAAAALKTAAPGGGKGLVWVNTSSNVYHCSDDAFYGKTKAGSYMTEDAAKAKGAHGDRGKSCAGK